MFYFWLYSLLTNNVSVHSACQINKKLLLINNSNSNNKFFIDVTSGAHSVGICDILIRATIYLAEPGRHKYKEGL